MRPDDRVTPAGHGTSATRRDEVAPDPTRHPVASRLRQWLREPQVLADPEQLEGDRVWTRAQDLLPGVVPQPGTPLTAAWGELVWFAVPEWDEHELDTLWLRPLGRPIEAPRLGAAHLGDAPPAPDGRTATPPPTPGVAPAALHPSVTELLEDFDWCLSLAAERITADRRLARRVLETLEQHCPEGLAALDQTETGSSLRALARRPAG